MAAHVTKICQRCFCSQARKEFVGRPRPHIDRIIRVDHAGELGANRIYAGQMAVLGRTSVGPTIQVLSVHCRQFIKMLISRCLALSTLEVTLDPTELKVDNSPNVKSWETQDLKDFSSCCTAVVGRKLYPIGSK